MSEIKSLVRDYLREVNGLPISIDEIARWAIQSNKYDLGEAVVLRACKRAIAQYFREQTFLDAKGRRVRKYHPAFYHIGGKQMMLWDSIESADRSHMEKSLQLRRNHILGECRQAKIDVDWYNSSRPEEPPLQLSFNFAKDIEESELVEDAEVLKIFEDKMDKKLERGEKRKTRRIQLQTETKMIR